MRQLLIIIVAVWVSACATTYQDLGFTGGVAAHQIGETRFRVEARGNAFTDISTVHDFVMLKAAETALEHGYEYFIVMDGWDASSTAYVTTPTTTNAQASVYGNQAYGSATTYGGQTYQLNRPGADLIIQLTNSRENATHSAVEIVRYVGPRVRGD